jgi:aminoglycoside/choline kinase family phosphotransferase
MGIGLCPRIIAADMAAGFLVLEDLAPRVCLDQLLRRGGAAAHGDRRAAFARARGALSAPAPEPTLHTRLGAIQGLAHLSRKSR